MQEGPVTQAGAESPDAGAVAGENNADTQRAERVARRLIVLLQELIERERLNISADTVISRLDVPPVEVTEEIFDEEAAARAGADGVYRALVRALS